MKNFLLPLKNKSVSLYAVFIAEYSEGSRSAMALLLPSGAGDKGYNAPPLAALPPAPLCSARSRDYPGVNTLYFSRKKLMNYYD